MTDNAPSFRSVMRGYDPTQVDIHLQGLASALDAARRETADRTAELGRTRTAHAGLAAQVEELRAHNQSLEDAQQSAEPPSYADLGERIGTILELADRQAAEMRAAGDRYLAEAHGRAETQVEALLEDARHRADQVLQDAERAARAHREEAEAFAQAQQEKASAATADFETALAERRDRAAAELSAQLTQHDQHLAEAERRAEALAQESAGAQTEARARAEALLEQARAEADALLGRTRTETTELVRAAQEQAEQVRAESARELAEATARRDSINTQLAKVRRMLDPLGGGAPTQEASPGTDEQATAPA